MDTYDILIIDDEIDNIQTIISCFERQNAPYNFVMANNGAMALDLIAKTIPDSIIVDWNMPEMSGIEVIKHIKTDEHLKHIPIIMLTGTMTTMEHLKEALSAGAIDFVKKPFDETELYARVHAALEFAVVIHEKQRKEQELINSEKKLLELKAKQLIKDMEQQKKELLNNAMQIHQAAKLQQTNLELLNQLHAHIKREGIPIMNELINNYRIYQKQNNWQLMESQFDEAFKDFDQKLVKQFPELTPNERRLCAFLHLNMTSKDIATITFQKESSINQARYRLRKKLKMNNDDNLISFLSRL